jgi:hypothetical protein
MYICMYLCNCQWRENTGPYALTAGEVNTRTYTGIQTRPRLLGSLDLNLNWDSSSNSEEKGDVESNSGRSRPQIRPGVAGPNKTKPTCMNCRSQLQLPGLSLASASRRLLQLLAVVKSPRAGFKLSQAKPSRNLVG